MFGDFAINLIRVGETSGVLSQNLNYLADELKKKQILRQKGLSALVYPAFITVMTFAVAILLTAYIFPKIMRSEVSREQAKKKANPPPKGVERASISRVYHGDDVCGCHSPHGIHFSEDHEIGSISRTSKKKSKSSAKRC